jgi:C4-dicarboxylate-binding protein DctP
MKRRLLSVLVVCLLLPPLEAGAQQVKLRAALQVAVTDPFFGVSLARFSEEVARRSDKAVSVEIFDKGQLFKDNQIADAVSSGAIEMGVAGLNWVAGKVPAAGILEQPFLFNFDALVRATTRPESSIRKLIDDTVLASLGMRVLWWQSLGNTIFISKGRDAADPQHIKDEKVRVYSNTLAELVTLCGGRPTLLSAAKLHEGLKDGTLDMAMSGLAALEARQLWQVADTVTRTEHAPVEYLLLINEKTWQSLSPAHRSVLANAAKDVERETRKRVADIEARAYAFAREKGMKVQELTPNQIAEWRACSADVMAHYMSKNGEMAHELMAAYGKLRTDPCCSAGPGSGAGFTHR